MERLWHFDKITGYRRSEGRFWFYSKDGFWWNGKRLNFDQSDARFYLKDKNNRNLYHRDLISIPGLGIRKLIFESQVWTLVDPQSTAPIRAESLENKSFEFLAVGGDNLEYDRILIAQLKPMKQLVIRENS